MACAALVGNGATALPAALFALLAGATMAGARTAEPGGVAQPAPASVGQDESHRAQPLRVYMVGQSLAFHRAYESLSNLAEDLQKNYGVQSRWSPDSRPPEFPALDQADVLVIYCRYSKPSDDSLQRFRAWCEAGKPLVAIRSSVRACRAWPTFDRDVLGCSYKGHHREAEVQVAVDDKVRDHPILRGVVPWTCKGKDQLHYLFADLAENTKVLLTGAGATGNQPVAWTRTADKSFRGRCFYTSLGLPEDFQQESFRTLLTNAIFWTADRPFPGAANRALVEKLKTEKTDKGRIRDQ